MTFLGALYLLFVVGGLLCLLWEGLKDALRVDHISDLWNNRGTRNR